MNIPSPEVSVLVPTYNHEAYIGTAIESVLAQDTSFPVEILIGDDCSTDGTAGIVAEFERRHPGRVRVLTPAKNGGGHANFSRLYKAARGKFIAQIEGDDYWTAREKLQKQVDFLRGNPEFSLCYHGMEVRHEGVEEEETKKEATPEITNKGDPEESGLERITRFNYIRTASSVFRNGLIEGLPPWVFELPLGDWPLFVLLAERGRIRYIDEVMGVYRVHGGGVWSCRTETERLMATVRVAEICRRKLGHPGFDDCVYKMSGRVASAAWENGEYAQAMRFTAKRLAALARNPGMKWKRRSKRSPGR